MERRLVNQAKEKQRNPLTQPGLNIAGVWQGTPGISYRIHQTAQSITIQEVNAFYGITAVGQGSISGRKINLSYQTALGTSGKGALTVLDNGRQMTGTFTDFTTGVSLPVTLYR